MRLALLIMVLAVCSCAAKEEKPDKEKIKTEIAAIEKEFAGFLRDSGVAAAFYKYAAEDAVIKRGNDSLIRGKEAIGNFYRDSAYQHAVAEWAPDFVDVSDDGTMAYTFGKYTWKFQNPMDGKETVYSGVFHTVWKKSNGSWRYVWD
jgi:ketosteroid isomerase-like protein